MRLQAAAISVTGTDHGTEAILMTSIQKSNPLADSARISSVLTKASISRNRLGAQETVIRAPVSHLRPGLYGTYQGRWEQRHYLRGTRVPKGYEPEGKGFSFACKLLRTFMNQSVWEETTPGFGKLVERLTCAKAGVSND